jgi:hypothetical protein
MDHGASWPDLSDDWGVFFTRLDNNGEVITIETYISDNPGDDGRTPVADYTGNDRLEVMWNQKTQQGFEVYHRQTVTRIN